MMFHSTLVILSLNGEHLGAPNGHLLPRAVPEDAQDGDQATTSGLGEMTTSPPMLDVIVLFIWVMLHEWIILDIIFLYIYYVKYVYIIL
jgi:hypothetical protein